jgi:hypothetical protein
VLRFSAALVKAIEPVSGRYRQEEQTGKGDSECRAGAEPYG